MKIHRDIYTSNNVLYYDTKKYLKKNMLRSFKSNVQWNLFSIRVLYFLEQNTISSNFFASTWSGVLFWLAWPAWPLATGLSGSPISSNVWKPSRPYAFFFNTAKLSNRTPCKFIENTWTHQRLCVFLGASLSTSALPSHQCRCFCHCLCKYCIMGIHDVLRRAIEDQRPKCYLGHTTDWRIN